ncbi:alpha/beta hydrolase [Marinomonas agarivorans]|nr:alpha/beta hydrolase [Marinomonas agarivorans]
MKRLISLLSASLALSFFSLSSYADADTSKVRYGTENVKGVNIFFREAGNPTKQAVVLLHGFPSSSYQYREVLSALGDEFYLIAPDYPGYGHSDKPKNTEYTYTFDNVAATMQQFLEQKSIKNYVLMIHDFGAPVGFRIATANPNDVAGFVVMNGNAYEEGLSKILQGSLQSKRTPEDEAKRKKSLFGLGSIKWQYTQGARNPESMTPDTWTLDHAIINQPDVIELNLDMLYDYNSNVALYPKWQQYLRDTQPPLLMVWGKGDPFFIEAGAEAYKRDVKEIDYHILDTGHFPLEEDAEFIVEKMRNFLKNSLN